jgi:hypothetical protein
VIAEPDVSSSFPVFNFNEFSATIPGPTTFPMGNSAYPDSFDLGGLSMDPDSFNMAFDWVRLFKVHTWFAALTVYSEWHSHRRADAAIRTVFTEYIL